MPEYLVYTQRVVAMGGVVQNTGPVGILAGIFGRSRTLERAREEFNLRSNERPVLVCSTALCRQVRRFMERNPTVLFIDAYRAVCAKRAARKRRSR